MRKILRLFVGLLLVMIMLSPALQAQQRTITGSVLSDTGSPLQGVTIKVKGTQRFTETDDKGNFTIQAGPGETLQFSFVGYEVQEMKPGTGNTLNISMK